MSSSKIGRNKPCICGSGRKYKKCCLPMAGPVNVSLRQPKLAGSFVGKQFHVHPDYGRKNVTFAELVGATGAFRLDSLLGEIRRHSHHIVHSNEKCIYVGSRGILATHPSLATIARAALLFEGQRGQEQLNSHELSLLLTMYWGLTEPAGIGRARPAHVKVPDEEIELHISRMMFLESPWQKERCHTLPRALLLFDLLANDLRPQDRDCLTGFVRDELGMPLYDFILVGFASWVYAAKRSGLLSERGLAEYVKGVPVIAEHVSSEKVARFLDITSASPARFVQAAGDWRAREQERAGSLKYGFNPLFRFPIVHLEHPVWVAGIDHEYIEPLEWLTLEAATHGNYFRLIDRRDGSLGNAFGHAFQTYVGRLIEEGARDPVLIPEEQYNFDGQPYDSADWVLVDGEEATIIECKTANLRIRAKEGASYDAYRDQLDELIKAVEQSFRYEAHVRSHAARWPKLSRVRTFHHLVVFYDPQYLGNCVMRRAAESRIGRSLGSWHVIDIADFEFLFDTLRRHSLSEILAAKESRDEWYRMDFHEFIPQYFSYDSGYRHPLLTRIWDKYFDFGSLILASIAAPRFQ